MRFLPLAALLLIAAAPAKNKKAASKAVVKKATVKALVDATMKKGEASTLDNPMAANLGYTTTMNIKDFIVADTSKDTQLASVVVLDGEGKPLELILSSTTVTQWTDGQPTAIDGYSCRADLNGKFRQAVRAHGAANGPVQDKVAGPETKKFFEGLLKAILTHSSVTAK